TNRDAACSIPIDSNSLSPRGMCCELRFMMSVSGRLHRLTTNSPQASACVTESFAPSLANATMGGRELTRLKKLYGAKLLRPLSSIVEIHPIGRGATMALIGSHGRP